MQPINFQVKGETRSVLKQGKREVRQLNDPVQQAGPQDYRTTLDLHPDTAGTVNDLYHPVEEATPGLTKTAVAAPLLDQCLHKTTHRDLHRRNVVIADVAPLLLGLGLRSDQDHPT